MTKIVLFLVDNLQWLFRILKVDFPSLRSIVEVKMMMENRRPHSLHQKNTQKEDENTFVKSLGFQVFFSFLFGAMLLYFEKTAYNLYLYNFSFIMFMIAFNMISDFIEVLFDTTDNIILIPRPVESKVIWMARLIHISVFIITITLANSLGSIVFTIIELGFLAGLVYFISVILLCLITIFLTGILYLLLTKIVSGEKLKDIIGYAQIFFTISLMVGYQIGARLVTNIFKSQEIIISWWQYFTPPAWFAALMEVVVNHHFETPYMVFITLILTVPFVSLFLMNKYLAPLFAKSLSEYGTPEKIEKQVQSTQNGSFLSFLSKKCTKGSLENAAFTFVWQITNRDRKFKIRAYPIFGLMIYYIFQLFSNDRSTGFNKWMVLYYTSFCIYAVSQQIFYSDDWKASWIFRNSPINKPGDILLGGLKVIIIKWAVPVFIFIGIVMFYKFGLEIIDDVIFAFVNTLLYIGVTVSKVDFAMPFSKSIADQNKAAKNFSRIIMLILVVPIMGGIHFLISKVPYGVIILTPIFLIIALILLKEYRQITWEKIQG
jgi:ABC-2 type transport system permease protein